MKGEDDDTSTELKDRQSFSEYDETFEGPLMSAPATSDVCDSCKTTEQQPSDQAEPARTIKARFDRFAVTHSFSSVTYSENCMTTGAFTVSPTTCHDVSLVVSENEIPSPTKSTTSQR